MAVRHGGALLDYLSLGDSVERITADLILNEAQEQDDKQREAFLNNLEIVIANAIGKAFKAK